MQSYPIKYAAICNRYRRPDTNQRAQRHRVASSSHDKVSELNQFHRYSAISDDVLINKSTILECVR